MDWLVFLWLLLRHTASRKQDARKGVRGVERKMQKFGPKCVDFHRGRAVCHQPQLHWWAKSTQNIQSQGLFYSAPFLFGPWMNTPYCNETCGTNRFYFELRTCVLVSPNLPANFSCQDQTTLRTGNKICPPSVIDCAGNAKHHDWSVSLLLKKVKKNCLTTIQKVNPLKYHNFWCLRGFTRH